MKEQVLDLTLDLPVAEVERMGDRSGEEILNRMRYEADRRAETAGGRVIETRLPEIIVRQGRSALLGDMVLVGTRWWLEVPDSFDPADGT